MNNEIITTSLVTTITELKKILNTRKYRRFRMRVTPEFAYQILSEFNKSNRRLRRHIVEKYVRLMQGGHWACKDGIESLKFNMLLLLFNGQHRLEAVYESGETVDFIVETYIDPSVAKFQDKGIGRKAYEDGDDLTGRIVAVSNYLTGMKLETVEAEQFYHFHQEAFDQILPIFAVKRNKIAISAVIGEFIKAYYYVNHDKLLHFAHVMITGMQDSKEDRTICRLRDQLRDGLYTFRKDANGNILYWPKIQYAIRTAALGKCVSAITELIEPCFILPGDTVEVISARDNDGDCD